MPFTEHDALEAAVKVASWSPCAKSKRGVVIFDESGVLADGFNVPPAPFVCGQDERCAAACNKICVHAEQRALLYYTERQGDADLLHVKVVDSKAVPSGEPSCWQCSRLILAVSTIKRVWLLHADGLRCYAPADFHRDTLRNNQLPLLEAARDW